MPKKQNKKTPPMMMEPMHSEKEMTKMMKTAMKGRKEMKKKGGMY